MKLTRVLVLMVITLFALAYGASHYFPRDEKPTALGNENSETPREEQPAPPGSPPISNMTFTYAENGGNCGGCSFILANGTITPNTPDEFQNFLDNLKKEDLQRESWTIYLNSPGGSISGAMRLGELIRTNNINTTVGHAQRSQDPADGHAYNFLDLAICNSACVLSFAGGVHRFYGSTSGLNPRWYVGSGRQILSLKGAMEDIAHERGRLDQKNYLSGIQDGLRASTRITEYLSRMGIEPNLIASELNSPNQSDEIFSEEQAYSLKLTNTPAPPLVWTLTQTHPGLEFRSNSVIENQEVSYGFFCIPSNPIGISLVIEIENLNFISEADIRYNFTTARWKSALAEPDRLNISAQLINTEIRNGKFRSEVGIPQSLAQLISENMGIVLEFDLPMALSSGFPTLEIHSPDLIQVLPQLLGNCRREPVRPNRIRR